MPQRCVGTVGLHDVVGTVGHKLPRVVALLPAGVIGIKVAVDNRYTFLITVETVVKRAVELVGADIPAAIDWPFHTFQVFGDV